MARVLPGTRPAQDARIVGVYSRTTDRETRGRARHRNSPSGRRVLSRNTLW